MWIIKQPFCRLRSLNTSQHLRWTGRRSLLLKKWWTFLEIFLAIVQDDYKYQPSCFWPVFTLPFPATSSRASLQNSDYFQKCQIISLKQKLLCCNFLILWVICFCEQVCIFRELPDKNSWFACVLIDKQSGGYHLTLLNLPVVFVTCSFSCLARFKRPFDGRVTDRMPQAPSNSLD